MQVGTDFDSTCITSIHSIDGEKSDTGGNG